VELSAAAILLALRVLREGKASAGQIASHFRHLAALKHHDQFAALQERLVRNSPELIEQLARLSVESTFVPVCCSECETRFRVHAWQMGHASGCPICDSGIVLSHRFADLAADEPQHLRAAETPPHYRAGTTSGRFAHFELIAPLGRGGMGKVYEALNRKHHRRVALKLLNLHPLEPRRASWQRLLREASLASSILHPHIVKVYDMGLAEGVPFVEMEFMPAGSLRQLVEREGPLKWRHGCRLLSEVLSGLAMAHQHGVIHRDLKPSNVLLGPQGHARLADFGLCKLLEETTSTTTGKLIGSPHFMAPEQWKGSQVGPWTDIYAAGLILYYVLSAHTAFEGENALSVMYKHLHFAVPDVREWAPQIPGELDRIIRKAAAKEPSDRFTSAEQFRSALEDLL